MLRPDSEPSAISNHVLQEPEPLAAATNNSVLIDTLLREAPANPDLTRPLDLLQA